MDKNLGESAAQKLNCDFLQMDMTDDKVVEQCTSETLSLHGKIDILVCSAVLLAYHANMGLSS